MPREAVYTANAPKPRPQLSQAIKCNGMVYCSGQLGVDPKTSKVVEGSVKDRARQVLRNMSAVLAAAGTSIDNVVKVNIFLISMADFVSVNEVYDEFFTALPKPVRLFFSVFF